MQQEPVSLNTLVETWITIPKMHHNGLKSTGMTGDPGFTISYFHFVLFYIKLLDGLQERGADKWTLQYFSTL